MYNDLPYSIVIKQISWNCCKGLNLQRTGGSQINWNLTAFHYYCCHSYCGIFQIILKTSQHYNLFTQFKQKRYRSLLLFISMNIVLYLCLGDSAAHHINHKSWIIVSISLLACFELISSEPFHKALLYPSCSNTSWSVTLKRRPFFRQWQLLDNY